MTEKRARKTSINKSRIIREIIAEHPEWKGKEIIAEAHNRGISIQKNFVYAIKSKLKEKSVSVDSGIVSIVRTCRQLVNQCGGVSAAVNVLKELESLFPPLKRKQKKLTPE